MARRRMRLLRGALCIIACVFDGAAQNTYYDDTYKVRIGGTFTLSGNTDDSIMSRKAFQGLQLVRDEVNRQTLVAHNRDTDGSRNRVTIQLVYFDDRGDLSRTEWLYREMIDNNAADFYVAPYKAEHVAPIVQLCDEKNKVLILHQEVLPELFTHNYTYLLSVNIPAWYLHGDLLKLLKERGADSMALSCNIESLYKIETCRGIVDLATDLGFSRIQAKNWSSGGMRMTELQNYITEVERDDPDLFLVVDVLAQEQALVLASRGNDFQPASFVFQNLELPTFTEILGPANVLNMISPVTWSKDIPMKDPVFGSSAEFHDKFVEEFGEAPTMASATAAAAGLVIVAAMQQLGVSPSWTFVPADIFRQVFSQIHVQTILGNLSWHGNGSVRGLNSSTIQAFEGWEHEQNRSAESIALRWIHGSSELFYPQLPWLAKELTMYPCDPGYLRNYTYHGAGECQECARGRARPPTSTVCLRCGNGFYNDQIAAAECQPCTPGMNCSAQKVDQIPQPEKGWYRIENQGSYTFWKCDNPDFCLGANRCYGHNRGTLCAQCEDGYTNEGVWAAAGHQDECRPCGSPVWSFMGFCALLLSFGAGVVVICLQHQSAVYSLRSISEVFLKIYVTYLQFHGILLEGSLDLLNKMGLGWLKIFSDVTVNPIDSLLGAKCLGYHLGLHQSTTVILLGLLTFPLLLLLSWIGFFVYAFYVVRTRIGAFTRDRHTVTLLSDAIAATHSVAFGDDFRRPEETASERSEEEDPESASPSVSKKTSVSRAKSERRWKKKLDREQARENQMPYYRSRTGRTVVFDDDDSESSEDAAVTVDMTSTYRDHSAAELKNLSDTMVVQRIMSHWVMFSHILLFVLHVPVLRTLLVAFTCRQYDVLRLASDLDIQCMGKYYSNWFSLTAFGVAMHGIAVPLFTLHRLCKVRNRLLQLNVRRSYGFLYNGFEPHRYYFEAISMLFKTVMLLVLACPDSTFRNFLQTCVVLAMQGASTSLRPWDDRAYFMFDKLEAMSQTALSCAAIGCLMFYMMEKLPDSASKDIVESDWLFYIAIVFCLSLHFAFNLFFFQRFLRHSVTKYLVMLREYFPDSLKFKDHVLLACLRSNLHYMTLENGHTLNVGALCYEEKEFVKKALYTTLYWYMAAEQKEASFRIDCLGPAISEAFKRCSRSSRGNVRHLLHKDNDFSRFGRVVSLFGDKTIHRRLLAVLDPHNLMLWKGYQQKREAAEMLVSGSRTEAIRKLRKESTVILGKPNLDLLLNNKTPEHVETLFKSRKAIAEDFQLALMVSWPSIRRGSPRYYKHLTWEARRFWTELFFTQVIQNPKWEERDSIGMIFDKLRICKKLERRQQMNEKGEKYDSDSDMEVDDEGVKLAKPGKQALHDLGMEPARQRTRETNRLRFQIPDSSARADLRRECREFFVWTLEVQAKVRHLRSRILCGERQEAADREKLSKYLQNGVDDDPKAGNSPGSNGKDKGPPSFAKPDREASTDTPSSTYVAGAPANAQFSLWLYSNDQTQALNVAGGLEELKGEEYKVTTADLDYSNGGLAADGLATTDKVATPQALPAADSLDAATPQALPAADSLDAATPPQALRAADSLDAATPPQALRAADSLDAGTPQQALRAADSLDAATPPQALRAADSLDSATPPQALRAADSLDAATPPQALRAADSLDAEQKIQTEARAKQSAKKLARPPRDEPEVRELDNQEMDRSWKPSKGRAATDSAHMTLGGLLGSALAATSAASGGEELPEITEV